MIIWQGLGFLVVIIAFGCFLLSELITRAATGDDHYYQAHAVPKVLAALVAAVLIYALNARLARVPVRIVIDKATGQEFPLRRKHTLFFIPIQYWPYVMLAVGLVVAFVTEPS